MPDLPRIQDVFGVRRHLAELLKSEPKVRLSVDGRTMEGRLLMAEGGPRFAQRGMKRALELGGLVQVTYAMAGHTWGFRTVVRSFDGQLAWPRAIGRLEERDDERVQLEPWQDVSFRPIAAAPCVVIDVSPKGFAIAYRADQVGFAEDEIVRGFFGDEQSARPIAACVRSVRRAPIEEDDAVHMEAGFEVVEGDPDLEHLLRQLQRAWWASAA